MRRNFNGAMLALILAAVTTAPALARGNDLIIKDGKGEEVTVKHGFFGRKTVVVKDRLGNGYATKQGLFGTKEQEGRVLGNSFKRKKGLLGGTSVEGSTILGDKVTTKKGIFGRRTTEVDIGGSTEAIQGLWKKFGPGIMGTTPPAPVKPAPTPNISAPSTDAPSHDSVLAPAEVSTNGNAF